MKGDYYSWIWQFGDTDCSPPENKNWITIFSGTGEQDDEICILVLREPAKNQHLIAETEATATQIVEALDAQLHKLGG